MPEPTALILYGASDDLLEVEGHVEDEFAAYGGCTVVVEAPTGERVWIRAVFDDDQDLRGINSAESESEWVLSVLHTDVLTVWPWPIRFIARHDERHDLDDPAVVIECPVGTTVREWTEDDRA
ncbi:hypothetical protein [Tsukamurella sp. 1534]|uniref:hypothetical protein n=1 Tax=Tsukamurella sp. 1534 TaxID=1151061 RepID=UPI0002EFF688|nr:hypothetical protein [Tsukamurella sp. 1534]